MTAVLRRRHERWRQNGKPIKGEKKAQASGAARRRPRAATSAHERTRTKTETLTKRLSPACSERRGCGRTKNLLRSLRSQHGARLRLRAERGPSPQELVKQASLAARLQDLDIIRLEAGIERREPAQWDELRVWDPGDG